MVQAEGISGCSVGVGFRVSGLGFSTVCRVCRVCRIQCLGFRVYSRMVEVRRVQGRGIEGVLSVLTCALCACHARSATSLAFLVSGAGFGV